MESLEEGTLAKQCRDSTNKLILQIWNKSSQSILSTFKFICYLWGYWGISLNHVGCKIFHLFVASIKQAGKNKWAGGKEENDTNMYLVVFCT